jgi:DNA-binding MarR family transcriptional regulator
MAYIPWWQRRLAPTLAERFELGGLARTGFKKGSDPIASLSFEQIRKLFPTYFDAAATATKVDEGVIKKILQMYANKEGGRTYIGKQLGLDQSVVGRILNKAEANNLITRVDPKDFKTTEAQRIYENPKARKIHNVVRPITALDRKQNPNIPKNAKFKIVFATPSGKTTKIPTEFQGVKYFSTETDAQVALNKRLKADFKTPEDPDAAKLKTQRKRGERLKRTAPFYPKTGTKGS